MSPAHVTARVCQATVEATLAHLATPAGMACWNLGLADCQETAEGLVTGVSRFDGSRGFARVVRLAGLDAVDYHVGPAPDRLVARIHARVIDGATLGHGAGTSLVMLLAWRPESMDEDRWQRLVAAHEAEIELIRAQLEHVAEPARGETHPAGASR